MLDCQRDIACLAISGLPESLSRRMPVLLSFAVEIENGEINEMGMMVEKTRLE
jgi:hypothetical protein